MPMQDASSIPRLRAHALNYAPAPSGSRAGLAPLYDNKPFEIDSDGFLQSGQRAGGPYLCSLPTTDRNIALDPESILIREEDDIKKKTGDILCKAGISFREIMLAGRLSKVNPEPATVPTIIVVANDGTADKWRDVAKQIHERVVKGDPEISVEIISSNLAESPCTHPVTNEEAEQWPDIRNAILDGFYFEEWTGLEFWKYGTCLFKDDNPTTIIVNIKLDSERQFDEDMEKVSQILKRLGKEDFAVLFMKDEFRPYTLTHQSAPLFPLRNSSKEVLPGMCIGIRDSSATSATLGGVVELQMKGDSNWQRFYLTSFHSIYPTLPSQQDKLKKIPGAQDGLERWKLNAPGFDDPLVRKVLQVDQPGLFDLKDAINRAACTGNETRRAEHQKFLDDKSYHLGDVCAGSGLHRTRYREIRMADGSKENEVEKPCLMDWALIEVMKERQGSLEPFAYSDDWTGRGAPFWTDMNTLPGNGKRLFNSGRKTGAAEGQLGVLQTRMSEISGTKGWTFLDVTYEYSLGGFEDRNFAGPGDAGSFITNNGEVAGMILGGYVRKGSYHFTFIKDVLDDIKEVTGADAVRLAVD
ncbi:hypothetical protein BO94DRAFT_545077 [Aspergillus sclerotioniger CBS 115572]|uniref:Uncharacterized protein n=1 Tax=Aspergillus sclerotioniger CBS 115572 TaxID=1450535 RepID=A0A317WVD4_9EURO|nr:hypothetical protein BO94DRAFT_545077 [Aspergillus sclerotioniger CBS 115572]PWY90319.1 hypothetical protein BO94DRAFT_545077 [Aspergillus sclerotioniger CBS 115572]